MMRSEAMYVREMLAPPFAICGPKCCSSDTFEKALADTAARYPCKSEDTKLSDRLTTSQSILVVVTSGRIRV